MYYKHIEELILMDITKELNNQNQKEWKEIKIQHRNIYGIVKMEYEANKILKEDLCALFDYNLIKEITFRIQELFTINNGVKTEYINPYLQNKVIHRISTHDLKELEGINHQKIYIICKDKSLSSIDYGYHINNNKLVLLNTVLKKNDIQAIDLLPLNRTIINSRWHITEYNILEDNKSILIKLQLT